MKKKLIIFLLVSLLALPLSHMGCVQRGAIDIQPPPDETDLSMNRSVSLDDLLAQVKQPIQDKIEALEDREDEESKIRHAKLLAQQEEIEKLDAELRDWNNRLAEKREEYKAVLEQKKAEAADKLGDEVESFSILMLEGKPDAGDPKYKAGLDAFLGIFAAVRVVAAFFLSGPVGAAAAAAISVGSPLLLKQKEKLTKKGKAGKLFEDDMDVPLEVKFCRDLEDDCKSFDVNAYLNTTYHVLYMSELDAVGFKDVGTNDMRVIKICATNETPVFRVGGVQVVVNKRLIYTNPFYGGNITANCISLNAKDDWVAIFEGRTRNKTWASGKRCTKDGTQGHMYAKFSVKPSPYLEQFLINQSVEKWMTEASLNDKKDTLNLKLRSPSNAWFMDMKVLNAKTLPLGEFQTFGDFGGHPRFSVRLSGDICYECAWCSDYFRFSLVRISDFVKAAKAGMPGPIPCFTYYRGKNYTFKKGFRSRGTYNLEANDCSRIMDLKGERLAEEGFFLPLEAYRNAVEIAREVPGANLPDDVPEDLPDQVILDARKAVNRSRNALGVLGEARAGVKPQGTLISVVEKKLEALEAMKEAAEATDDSQKECRDFEEVVWSNMVNELWLDSLGATIAQGKAQYAQLDGEIKHMEAGTDVDLLIQATMALGEVDEHVAVVKAEKDAAITTFKTPCPEKCCEQTTLVLPTVDEENPDAAEANDQPPGGLPIDEGDTGGSEEVEEEQPQ